MNREEFFKFHKDFCNSMHEICLLKNKDYADRDTNPFSNFEKAEVLGICSNEAGILVRIMDKVSRVVSFLNKGELAVKDESVTDSLKDAANYFILLAAYIEHKKELDKNIKVIDSNTELNEVDKEILKLLTTDKGSIERNIYWNFVDEYSPRAITYSLDKLLTLGKIEELGDFYKIKTQY